MGARVPSPAPVPPSDLPALRVGGAARRLGGEGRGGGGRTAIFPGRGGNLEAPPPTPTPGTGPGKFAREKKKLGEVAAAGPGGGARVARGLRAAPTHSGPRPPPPSRAPAPARGPWHPRGRGPRPGERAGGFGRGGWRGVRLGRGSGGRPGGEAGWGSGAGWGKLAPRDELGRAGAAPQRARTGRGRRGGTPSPDGAGVLDRLGAGSGGAAPPRAGE